VVGQSEGALLPMTAHGMHVMTPGGHVDAVYNHTNRWKPRVQEASVGPTPEQGKAGRTPAAAPIIVQVRACLSAVNRSLPRHTPWPSWQTVDESSGPSPIPSSVPCGGCILRFLISAQLRQHLRRRHMTTACRLRAWGCGSAPSC